MPSTTSAGAIVTSAPQDQRDRAVDEALHDDLAGVGADARGREAGREQGERERQRGARPDERAERRRGRPRSCRRRRAPEPWNSDAAMTSIDMLITPGDAHRDQHVDALEAEDPAALGVVARGIRRCVSAECR